jgi:hypothetical protein
MWSYCVCQPFFLAAGENRGFLSSKTFLAAWRWFLSG